MPSNSLLFVLLGLVPLMTALAGGPGTAAPKKPASNEYHGVTVQDDYQWLENDNDPEVKAWSDAQNQKTRAYLDKLPDRAAVEKQLTDWFAKTSPSYSGLVARPGILFALKFQPPKQQQILVRLASA